MIHIQDTVNNYDEYENDEDGGPQEMKLDHNKSTS